VGEAVAVHIKQKPENRSEARVHSPQEAASEFDGIGGRVISRVLSGIELAQAVQFPKMHDGDQYRKHQAVGGFLPR